MKHCWWGSSSLSSLPCVWVYCSLAFAFDKHLPSTLTWLFACVHVSGVYHRQQLWSTSQLKLEIIWFDSELFQQTCFNRIASFLDSASWETLEALPADCSTGVIYLTGFKLFFHHKLVRKGPFFLLSCTNYTWLPLVLESLSRLEQLLELFHVCSCFCWQHTSTLQTKKIRVCNLKPATFYLPSLQTEQQ